MIKGLKEQLEAKQLDSSNDEEYEVYEEYDDEEDKLKERIAVMMASMAKTQKTIDRPERSDSDSSNGILIGAVIVLVFVFISLMVVQCCRKRE